MTRPGHAEPVRTGLVLAAALALLSCGAGEPPGGDRSLEEVGEILRSKGGEMGRKMAERADDALEEVEQARRAIEEILENRPGLSRSVARQARERAERALEQGAEALRRVGDRGETPEDWARLLQESMTRLERTLDELTTRSGQRHADS